LAKSKGKNISWSVVNQIVIDPSIGCTIDSDAINKSFLLYKKVTEQYNDQKILKNIRRLIPDTFLWQCNNESKNLLVFLLRWFKEEFMHWTPNQIVCCNCRANVNAANSIDNSKFIMKPKIVMGQSWKLRKTEIYTCSTCGAVHTFPRYGEVLRISQTRTGRCSEWSILFGAILSSVHLRARIVHDYLDHCWNEVLIGDDWIHVDSTLQYPISLNHPHYYEQYWEKKYLYVLAFDSNKVEDVTLKYTEQWDNVLLRRKQQQQESNHDNDNCISCNEQDYASIINFQNIYSDII
jgi:peptide-N4-(N-acetyl-beta-glucosaminyl)asparagine amidase